MAKYSNRLLLLSRGVSQTLYGSVTGYLQQEWFSLLPQRLS